jgi:hypothetical protein
VVWANDAAPSNSNKEKSNKLQATGFVILSPLAKDPWILRRVRECIGPSLRSG